MAATDTTGARSQLRMGPFWTRNQAIWAGAEYFESFDVWIEVDGVFAFEGQVDSPVPPGAWYVVGWEKPPAPAPPPEIGPRKGFFLVDPTKGYDPITNPDTVSQATWSDHPAFDTTPTATPDPIVDPGATRVGGAALQDTGVDYFSVRLGTLQNLCWFGGDRSACEEIDRRERMARTYPDYNPDANTYGTGDGRQAPGVSPTDPGTTDPGTTTTTTTTDTTSTGDDMAADPTDPTVNQDGTPNTTSNTNTDSTGFDWVINNQDQVLSFVGGLASIFTPQQGNTNVPAKGVPNGAPLATAAPWYQAVPWWGWALIAGGGAFLILRRR